MACKLEDDPMFFILAGVARDRRSELGDAADLKRDPVWVAALCLLGLEEWDDEPNPQKRMKHARGVIEAMRPASISGE
jgi:hypothetical protein